MMNKFLQQIENSNLPLFVFGNGEVTHLIIGKITFADGKGTEGICIILQPQRAASGDFTRKLNSPSCQCGKQKHEGKPLCGICYSRLDKSFKLALREVKGAELEETYYFAAACLRQQKTGGQREKKSEG